jgi:D-lactate dehydrogenase
MKTIFFEIQDWEKEILMKTFPDATYTNDALTEENASQYADAEIVSTFIFTKGTKELLEKLPSLKLITTRSTGFDHIDTDYCKERGIIACNVPEYGSRTVAEYTFGLMLMITRKLYPSVLQSKECIFDTSVLEGVDLFGKTLGIIGLGRIGHEVLKIAKGFNMRLVVHTEYRHLVDEKEWGFEYAELDDLLAQSDVITLHLPLLPSTHHVLNKENILKIKKGAYLVNTARGGLIETEAILLALEKDILAGVALDVLEEEKAIIDESEYINNPQQREVDFKTLCIDHVLMHHPKVLVTPHNAFNSHEALVRILESTAENIKSFTESKPVHTVPPEPHK